MNINSLNNVQNFSVKKNFKPDNTVTNPNFKAQETVEPPQTALAKFLGLNGNDITKYVIKDKSLRAESIFKTQISALVKEGLSEKKFEILENIKCFTDEKTGEKITLDQFLEKSIQPQDVSDITFYHGTTIECAKSIEKNGMNGSSSGKLLKGFDGAYFTIDKKVANYYAKVHADNKKTTPATIVAKLEQGAKIAVLPNNKPLDFIIDKISKNTEISQILKNADIKSFNIGAYIQNKLQKKGYVGLLCSSGYVIFDRTKIHINSII